ncbi:transmembrane protein 170A isoform X2 [Hydra vulgaris]|uniref:Transmembrane protein 170A isoform X2 n=1 Tax=Hydra vulgaris TaxID=6087 RepID=A0ABM4D4Q8_HYDVU
MEKSNNIQSFNAIWYQIFLYCLATVLFVHIIAALVAFFSLRKHQVGRYLCIVLFLYGFLYPLTGGFITSVLIAWIYSAAGYTMEKNFAFVYGAGQALVLFLVSFIHLYGLL